MNWNLEGLKVEAVYLGEVPVVGRVEESRVAYGGTIKHTVRLDTPVKMRWRDEPADRLIVDHETVSRVFSN